MKGKFILINLLISVCAFPIILFRLINFPLFRLLNLIRAKTKLFGVNPTVQFDGKIDIVGTANIFLDNFTRIGDSVQLGTEESGKISIGKYVRVNRGTTIFSYNSISIGDYSLIGEYVTIRDANHGIRKGEYIKTQEHYNKSIVIGEDVWIGRGVCVLPGVNIGDGCVIGANSVVTKSVKSNMIVVGIPARVIRER